MVKISKTGNVELLQRIQTKPVSFSKHTLPVSKTTNIPDILLTTAQYLSFLGVLHLGQDSNALPIAPKDPTIIDNFHGQQIADPYRPLENLNSLEIINWWKAQNKRTEAYLYKADAEHQDAIKWHEKIRDYTSESMRVRYGDNYFFMRQNGLTPQPISYVNRGGKDAEPQILIDPNKLSNNGTVAISMFKPSPDGKLLAYTVSESGSDWEKMYFRDVKTGKDIYEKLEGLRFTQYTGITWDVDGKGIFYTKPLNGFAVYHHTLGEDQSKDVPIYKQSYLPVKAFRLNNDDPDLFIGVSRDIHSENGLYFRKSGKTEFKEIFPPHVAKLLPFYRNGDILYATTNLNALRNRIVSIDMNNPAPSNWKTIIPESKEPNSVLKGSYVADGKLLVHWSKESTDALEVCSLEGKHLYDADIPPASSIIIGQVSPDDKEFEFNISGFLSPTTRYKYNVADNKLTLVKKSNISRDLTNIAEVEHLYATSKDGTKVPMWVIKPKDIPKDGSSATILYGYGGHNISLKPIFSEDVMHWVEKGGVYVMANIRGGGEFGKPWYDAGRLKNKQNSYDDFIACAEKLIKDGYTKPERLAIEGSSHGGLLTAVVSQQRPDLFGAVISNVPVTDMLRFPLNNFGALWISEFGNPAKKEDFESMIKYSPLHNVKSSDEVKYPPTLIMTADHDDRVAPWHSFKWVATRQDKGQQDNTFLYVDEKAGHGGDEPTQKSIKNDAYRYAFLVRTLGPLKPEKH